MLSGTRLTFTNLLLSSSATLTSLQPTPSPYLVFCPGIDRVVRFRYLNHLHPINCLLCKCIHTSQTEGIQYGGRHTNDPTFHVPNHYYFSSSTSLCYHPVHTIPVLQFSALCSSHYVILQLQNITKPSFVTAGQAEAAMTRHPTRGGGRTEKRCPAHGQVQASAKERTPISTRLLEQAPSSFLAISSLLPKTAVSATIHQPKRGSKSVNIPFWGHL